MGLVVRRCSRTKILWLQASWTDTGSNLRTRTLTRPREWPEEVPTSCPVTPEAYRPSTTSSLKVTVLSRHLPTPTRTVGPREVHPGKSAPRTLGAGKNSVHSDISLPCLRDPGRIVFLYHFRPLHSSPLPVPGKTDIVYRATDTPEPGGHSNFVPKFTETSPSV